MEDALLSLRNVTIRFGKVTAVKNASLDIQKGEIFALVGESGSGKSTIGRAIMGITPCSEGEIFYAGKPLAVGKRRSRKIQMVFQDPAASLNERSTVEQIVAEGLIHDPALRSESQRREKVRQMLQEVGLLTEHLSRYPHEFSGGQRQRIGIARAMVMQPEMVVADEPISALDVSVRAQILNLMKRFQKEQGTTFLFIAHDLSVVRYVADRIGVIRKGKILEVASAEELFRHPLHPYTRSLLSAIPIPDPILERNKNLLTYDPSIHKSQDGTFTEVSDGHWVYGSDEEIQAYRSLRNRQIPLPEELYQPIQPTQQYPMGKVENRRSRGLLLGLLALVGAWVTVFLLCLLLAHLKL